MISKGKPKLADLAALPDFKAEILHHPQAEIRSVYCCDLLSRAMSRAPAGCAWITVMGNVNAIAVASLTETACIILAEGALLQEDARVKGREKGINIFSTPLPIYEAACTVGALLRGEKNDRNHD